MMITFQCDALVDKFHVTPLVIGLVAPICLRFVALSGVFNDGCSYLSHGKNELFAGLVEASADETYRNFDNLWNGYTKDEGSKQFENPLKRDETGKMMYQYHLTNFHWMIPSLVMETILDVVVLQGEAIAGQWIMSGVFQNEEFHQQRIIIKKRNQGRER